VLAGAFAALPDLVNPLALSLNENPFPPLPAARAALMKQLIGHGERAIGRSSNCTLRSGREPLGRFAGAFDPLLSVVP
jgi:hypothetical protein